jgi:hypothetical protein
MAGPKAAAALRVAVASVSRAGHEGRAASRRARRRTEVRAKPARAAVSSRPRASEGSHHHEEIQKKRERNGTVAQGARTTRSPGSKSSARRLAMAKGSSSIGDSTRWRGVRPPR